MKQGVMKHSGNDKKMGKEFMKHYFEFYCHNDNDKRNQWILVFFLHQLN